MTQTPEEPIHPDLPARPKNGNGGGNGPPPPPPKPTPNPIPPGNYLVTLVALSCDKSRATFTDSIWIGAAAQSNLHVPAQWQTRYVGSVDNGSGYHELNIDVTILRVNPGEELKFCHIILNYGDSVAPQIVLDTLAEVAISELAPVAFVRPLDLKQVSDNVNNLLLNSFRGCDGLVAAHNFKCTSDQLEQGTKWAPPWAGSEVSVWTEERGYDSAFGCGSNSHYWVQWIIRRYQ